MAEVPITINGVICDLYGRTITGPVKIVGSLMKSDVSIGGGPIIPPPDAGGPPENPPSDPTVVKPPPPNGGWGWVPEYGWGYFPGPGEAEPKK